MSIETTLLNKHQTLGPSISKDVTSKIKSYLSNKPEDYITKDKCDNILYINDKGRIVFTLKKCIKSLKNYPSIKIKDKIYKPMYPSCNIYAFNDLGVIVAYHNIRMELMKYLYNINWKAPYNKPNIKVINASVDVLNKILNEQERHDLSLIIIPLIRGKNFHDNAMNYEYKINDVLAGKIFKKIDESDIDKYKYFIVKIAMTFLVYSEKFTFVNGDSKQGDQVKYIMDPKRWYIKGNLRGHSMILMTTLYSYFDMFKNDTEIFQGVCRGLLGYTALKFLSGGSRDILICLVKHLEKKMYETKKFDNLIVRIYPLIMSKFIDAMLNTRYTMMDRPYDFSLHL